MTPVKFSFIWGNSKVFLVMPALMLVFHLFVPLNPAEILGIATVFAGLLLFRVVGLINQYYKASPLITAGAMAGYILATIMIHYDWATDYIALSLSLITASFTILHAKGDAYRQVKGLHWKRLIYRSAYLLTVAYIGSNSFTEGALLALNQALLFGVIFDPARNTETGLAFFYHGGESWYDKIVKKSPQLVFYSEIAAYVITLIAIVRWN